LRLNIQYSWLKLYLQIVDQLLGVFWRLLTLSFSILFEISVINLGRWVQMLWDRLFDLWSYRLPYIYLMSSFRWNLCRSERWIFEWSTSSWWILLISNHSWTFRTVFILRFFKLLIWSDGLGIPILIGRLRRKQTVYLLIIRLKYFEWIIDDSNKRKYLLIFYFQLSNFRLFILLVFRVRFTCLFLTKLGLHGLIAVVRRVEFRIQMIF